MSRNKHFPNQTLIPDLSLQIRSNIFHIAMDMTKNLTFFHKRTGSLSFEHVTLTDI